MQHLSKYLFQLIMFVGPGVHAQQKVPDIQWKSAAQLPAMSSTSYQRGVAGGASGFAGDLFVLAGGANFPSDMPWNGGKKKYYDDVLLFKRSGDILTPIVSSSSLPFALAYGASCSVPGGVVILGGETEHGLTDKTLLIKNSGGVINVDTLPSIPYAMANGSAVYDDHFIYYAGGETNSTASDKLLRLDVNNLHLGWKEMASIPHAVSHFIFSVQFSREGKSLFIMGGRKKNQNTPSDFFSESYRYSIDSDKWTKVCSIPVALAAGTGSPVGKRWVFLFGGDEGKTFRKTEQLIFSIAREKDAEKAKELVAAKAKLQSGHPGFSNQVWAYDTYEDKWQRAGYIPFPAPVTTVAVKWNNEIFIPSGEIKAGIRTPEIISARIIDKQHQTSFK